MDDFSNMVTCDNLGWVGAVKCASCGALGTYVAGPSSMVIVSNRGPGTYEYHARLGKNYTGLPQHGFLEIRVDIVRVDAPSSLQSVYFRVILDDVVVRTLSTQTTGSNTCGDSSLNDALLSSTFQVAHTQSVARVAIEIFSENHYIGYDDAPTWGVSFVSIKTNEPSPSPPPAPPSPPGTYVDRFNSISCDSVNWALALRACRAGRSAVC